MEMPLFFFSSRRRHTSSTRDWSSDVCSSDLQLKRFFGLDQPWYVQYGRWMGQLAHGDLGTSWRTGKPVLSLILERLPVTLELTLLAVGFSLLLGIAAGIVSATRRDGALDNVTRVGTLLGLSV